MTDYDEALRRRRKLFESLEAADTDGHRRKLWQLTMLYALHFDGDAEPSHHDVIELLMKEKFAFMILSATNIRDLWKLVREDYMKQAAGGIAWKMPANCTPDTTTVLETKTAIVQELRDLMEATTDERELAVIWLQATVFEAVRVKDIQGAWLYRQKNPGAATA